MYAVIKTGGKQYRVAPGDLVTVEKLAGDPGAALAFDEVLMVGEGEAVESRRAFRLRRQGLGRSRRAYARREDHRLQEAPAAELAAQERPPPGSDGVAHHRDRRPRQGRAGRRRAAQPKRNQSGVHEEGRKRSAPGGAGAADDNRSSKRHGT